MKRNKMMSPSRLTYRTRLSSQKNGEIIYTESLGEAGYARTLEVDPFVKRYASQAMELEYWFEGKWRSAYVDFVVQHDCYVQTILREVKGDDRWKRPQNILRYLAIRKAAQLKGYHYAVVTSKWVFSEPRNNNVDHLYRYRFFEVDEDVQSHVYRQLHRQKKMTIKDITKHSMISMEELWALIAQGKILSNIHIDTPKTFSVWLRGDR